VNRVLITGSRGLIGSALARRLQESGREVVPFDVAAGGGGQPDDILDAARLAAALAGCGGVVHLAAVSRVVWGERDPARCRTVNVEGTRNVLTAARESGRDPWVLVASSREVYGDAVRFPVPESAPFAPLNAYARSKADVEEMVAASRAAGLCASVVRFSSVYGSTADHFDRVAPAFARQAAAGQPLRVDGTGTTLDFTHLDDVAAALHRAVDALSQDHRALPPLHLVSGRAITLLELAEMTVKAAGRGRVEVGPARPYDVRKFVGDPARAAEVLGWRASTPLEDGMARLVQGFGAP
jgi:nucleoside-diphosphate-sugar epimerase